MSYDIYFADPKTGDTVHLPEPHTLRGGTYMLGGTPKAWLNITYNYSPFYYEHIDEASGIRALYGKTGRECAPILKAAIAKLGTQRLGDYWAATPGNAGAALADLLVLAEAFPDAICKGD